MKKKLYKKCELCHNVFLISSNVQRFCGNPTKNGSCSFKNKAKQTLVYRKNNPEIVKKIYKNQNISIIKLRIFYNKYKDLVKKYEKIQDK